MIYEKEIVSVGDFLDKISIIEGKKKPSVGDEVLTVDWSTRLLYRGQRDAQYSLAPGIFRAQKDGRLLYDEDDERFFSREFKARAVSRHHVKLDDENYTGWLSLMQHYGLPTRILDWSFSPLVALYFGSGLHTISTAKSTARADELKVDGAVFILNPVKLNESQGFSGHIYPINAKSYEHLIIRAFKNRKLHNVTGVDSARLVRRSKHFRNELSSAPNELKVKQIGVCLAAELDPRIQLQQGAFTIHGIPTPLEAVRDTKEFLIPLRIPAKNKERIWEELQSMGITLSYLFPDLDSLSLELRARVQLSRKPL